MTITDYINRVKFSLTGGILTSEIKDEGYEQIVKMALQDVNRYYDSTQLVQVTASRCIDLAKLEQDHKIKINSIAQIYRTRAQGLSGSQTTSDPMLLSQWNLGFGMYGVNRWVYNYAAYNTMQQVSNTLSTDLDFKEDKLGKKLYVNYSSGTPSEIVIEYVPRLDDPAEVVGDYWIDILTRLSLAYAKITLGRIRSRFTQSDAIWTQDGEKLLEEGTTELNDLRTRLQDKSNFMIPLD